MPNFNEIFRARLNATKQTFLKDVTNWLTSQTTYSSNEKKNIVVALQQISPDQVLAKIDDLPITRVDSSEPEDDFTYFSRAYICTLDSTPVHWQKICDILTVYDRLLQLESLLIEPQPCDVNIDTLKMVAKDAINAAGVLNLPGHRGDCTEHYADHFRYLNEVFEDAKGYNEKVLYDRKCDTSTSGSDLAYILDALIQQQLKGWYQKEPAEDFKYRFWFSPWQNIWENLSKNLFDSSIFYGKVEERNLKINAIQKDYSDYQNAPFMSASKNHNELVKGVEDALSRFGKALEAKGMRMNTDKQLITVRSPMDPLQYFSAARMFGLFTSPSVIQSHPLLRLITANARQHPAEKLEDESLSDSPSQNHL